MRNNMENQESRSKSRSTSVFITFSIISLSILWILCINALANFNFAKYGTTPNFLFIIILTLFLAINLLSLFLLIKERRKFDIAREENTTKILSTFFMTSIAISVTFDLLFIFVMKFL